MAKGKASRLKALAQQAAAKVDVLERFNKTSGLLLGFGERVGAARRKVLAGAGFGAAGLAVGIFFFSFPQSLLLAPLLGVSLGTLGALVTPSSVSENRLDTARQLLELRDQAETRGMLSAAEVLEAHFITVTTSEANDLKRLIAPYREQKLLPTRQVNSSDTTSVIEAEIVEEELRGRQG